GECFGEAEAADFPRLSRSRNPPDSGPLSHPCSARAGSLPARYAELRPPPEGKTAVADASDRAGARGRVGPCRPRARRLATMPAVAVDGFLADPAVAGQVHLADHRAAGAQDRPLDHVAELADVALPGVAHQLRERLVGEAVDALLACHLGVAEELADEQRDVL